MLGGGTAGITAARSARHHGARVLLVDRGKQLGGECTFSGCVPSKTLIEAARLLWEIKGSWRMGIHVDGLRLDFAQLMAHKDRVIADISRDEADETMRDAGIDVHHGSGAFIDAHRLAVGDAVHRADHVVLAQGSDPFLPRIPGLDMVTYHTNETIFSLAELPRRLTILGGGPMGVELGQCFLRLGSAVTVVTRDAHLLPREEPEVCEEVRRFLEREGMTVHTSARVEQARSESGDTVFDLVDERGVRVEARGDQLLVAAGRSGRTAGLGLEQLGVRTDRRRIPVDASCRTNVPHVFAAGDVTGTHRFTHWAAHQGRVAGANAAGKRQRTNDRVMPWVTFLDPEVARVGLTEEQARERHRDVATARFPFSRIDRARTTLETDGWVKVIVSRPPVVGAATGGKLVGAHIIGAHAGELIHELVLSMQARTFAGRVAQAIHAYPTLAVGVQQAMAQLFPAARALSEADPPTG